MLPDGAEKVCDTPVWKSHGCVASRPANPALCFPRNAGARLGAACLTWQRAAPRAPRALSSHTPSSPTRHDDTYPST